jgi:hypothetical protein
MPRITVARPEGAGGIFRPLRASGINDLYQTLRIWLFSLGSFAARILADAAEYVADAAECAADAAK